MNATYSPEDNKLRLYSETRLSAEEYARVKARGFKWAPKQELFVAPMWTPEREDLLLELCGEIGDEDTSLVERAEQRAERFEDYSESRASDSQAAHKAVSAIADNIPLGQPILVGHHSERRARKDAERIENGMRKAVKMWEQSEYWTRRAKGTIRAAKYKELPAVRARRIKGIEADKRRQEKYLAQTSTFLKTYDDPQAADKIHTNPYTGEQKPFLHALLGAWESGLSSEDRSDFEKGQLSFDEAMSRAKASLLAYQGTCNRWIAHYDNRLAYERTMLEEQGGTEADRTKPEKGGACRCWASPRGGYSLIQKVNRVSVSVLDNWGNGGKDFSRVIPFDKLFDLMTKAQVDKLRADGQLFGETPRGFILSGDVPATAVREIKAAPAEIQQLKASLEAGVKVVSANQLFPTPPEIARRLVELADIRTNQRILEPSAGTGNILHAILGVDYEPMPPYCGAVFAVEINPALAEQLAKKFPLTHVLGKDFLACNGELGTFDRIVMNPPFQNGQDIAHINHALTFLKPGGKLIAICANGPRQQAQLKPRAQEWIELEPGSFSAEGTNVNAAIAVFTI